MTLVAMAAYAVPEMDGSAVIQSRIWLDQGTCRPASVQFDILRYEDGETLTLLKMNISTTISEGRAHVPESLYSSFIFIRSPESTGGMKANCS